MTTKLLVPEGKCLRPYQEEGALWLSGKNSALLMDSPGLGKTAQAIVAMETRGASTVLVLCPSAVRYSWANEIRSWSVRKRLCQIVEGTRDWIEEISDVVICSYSLIHSPMIFDQLKERRWSLLLMDEVHFCKSHKAQRTKLILGRSGLIKSAVLTWGLSGTPMTNTPIDLYPIAASMARQHFDSYTDWFNFTRRFCGRFKDKFGRWNVQGATNLGDMRNRLFSSGFALRRETTQVLKELPERTYRCIPVKGSLAKIKDIGDPEFDDTGVLTDKNSVSLRQEVCESKKDGVITYVKECLETEKKLVVFTWHRALTEELAAELEGAGLKVSTYYGGMSLGAKELAKKSFCSGVSQVFVANICSAGTGLDGLQLVCQHCVFAEIPWTYVELYQATGRLWRIGQEGHVIADILLLKDSFEEKVFAGMKKKRKVFQNIFEAKA